MCQCLQHGGDTTHALGTPPHCPGTAGDPPQGLGAAWGHGPVSRDPLTVFGDPLMVFGDPAPVPRNPLGTRPQCPGTPSTPPAPAGGAQHRSGAQSGWGLCAHRLEQFGQCQPSCYPAQPLRSLWGVPPALWGALPIPRFPPGPEVSYNFLIKAFDIPAPPLSRDLGGTGTGWGGAAEADLL